MDSVCALALECVGPEMVTEASPLIVRRFAALFPEAQEPVLFFGPLGFQKRAPFSSGRSMDIGSGMSALIPEGEVLVLEYASVREAGVRYDSLLYLLGNVADPAAGQKTWSLHSRDAAEVLVARKEEYLVILAGPNRERLLVLWHRLEEGQGKPESVKAKLRAAWDSVEGNAPGGLAERGQRVKNETPRADARGFHSKSGNDLLSHTVTRAVPSALEGLTAEFGMGSGVTPPLWSPEFQFRRVCSGSASRSHDGVALRI